MKILPPEKSEDGKSVYFYIESESCAEFYQIADLKKWLSELGVAYKGQNEWAAYYSDPSYNMGIGLTVPIS